MSKMANAAGPSLAPEFAMAPAGSRVGISPAFSHVMAPPIWTSTGGAVLLVAATLPPTCGALVRLWLGAATTALFFLAVVVVAFFAVVVVTLPAAAAVVDVSPGTVVAASPAAAVVSLVTVVAVVLLLAVPF